MQDKLLNALSAEGASFSIFEGLVKQGVNLSAAPSAIVDTLWSRYKTYPSNPSVNGNVFEKIIALVLLSRKIEPIFEQAKVAFVPNVIFDLLLYNKASPVALSLKTSLRERYKQADLESIALKYVHRRAKAFLITLNKTEADGVRDKIACGDVLGLDDVIVADSAEFDAFIDSLSKISFEDSTPIQVVESTRVLRLV